MNKLNIVDKNIGWALIDDEGWIKLNRIFCKKYEVYDSIGQDGYSWKVRREQGWRIIKVTISPTNNSKGE